MTRLVEKTIKPDYLIILYYKYVAIDQPETLAETQKALCSSLNLKGRIIISSEGINGTLEGSVQDVEQYCKKITEDVRFADMQFKRSVGIGNAFPKLSVKARKEIVSAHLGGEDVNPAELTATHLSPDQLQSWFEQGKEFAIVDMRNDYEQEVGHFKGSIMSGMKNFRDLPETAKKIDNLKDKPVLTVCTGGVRCEKASGYLLKKGFKNVYQLDGGIVSYMEKYPGKNFLGSLYVFDGRVTVHFDSSENHTVVGKCALCGDSSERYIDCRIDSCHYQFICCTNCSDEEGKAFCERCIAKGEKNTSSNISRQVA